MYKTTQQIHELRHEHLLEKLTLKRLGGEVTYRINNPELIQQRSVVRKLQDKIIRAESYDMYLTNYKPICTIRISECCDNKLKYSYLDWCSFGNCCRECNKEINRKTHKILENKTNVIKTQFMKEMEMLELADMAEEDKLY